MAAAGGQGEGQREEQAVPQTPHYNTDPRGVRNSLILVALVSSTAPLATEGRTSPTEEKLMVWSTFLDVATRWVPSSLAPAAAVWVALWPARHALLSVALILLYVHRYEPESDEDIFTF